MCSCARDVGSCARDVGSFTCKWTYVSCTWTYVSCTWTHCASPLIHLILRPILRQLRLPVSIINQQSPPAATFDHHLLLNSCPSPDFLCPDKKRFLKIYYRKLRPPKKAPVSQKNGLPLLNSCPSSDFHTLHCEIQLSNAIEPPQNKSTLQIDLQWV